MRQLRVWELARETGLSSRAVLDRLEALGVDVTTHASSVSEDDARRLRGLLAAERDGDRPAKVRVYELAESLGMDSRAVMDLLDVIGVRATTPVASVWKFDAERLLSWLDVTHQGPLIAGRNGPPVQLRDEHERTRSPRGTQPPPHHVERALEPPVRPSGDAPDERAAETAEVRDSAPSDETSPRDDADPQPTGPVSTRRSDAHLVRRVLGELRPYWRGLTGLVSLDLLATPIALLKPVPLAIAIDTVLGDDPLPSFIAFAVPDVLMRTDLRLLFVAAALQVLIVLLGQLQSLGTYVLHTYTGERLTRGMRAKLFSRAQQLSLSFHYRHGPTESLYRIEYDAPSVQHTVDSVLPLISSAATFAAMLYVMLRIDWQLALVALTISPILFVLSRGYAKRVRPRYRRLRELERFELGVVQEVLSAIRVVKAFGREERERERFIDHADRVIRERLSLSVSEGGFGLAINLTVAIGTALVLFIGVRNVMAGTLSLGLLVIVLGYLAQLYEPLRSVSERIGSVQDSIAGVERAFELLDEEVEVEERPDARRLDRARGGLVFDGLHFSYDGQTDVLRDISFAIDPGTCLGIMGRTGAGKTTLVSLVTRFYDPDRGRILLDGVDLRDYKLNDLRAQFALVLQEPVLFSASIAENLRYARPDASDEELREAAIAADAQEFITSLPRGYDTVVGDRGMRLSGGERQRISIARAFLKDAPILILDEPTSAVDRETEAAIMRAMQRLMEGRTTLMIAHRLSTLEHCDALIELHDGRATFVGKERVRGPEPVA